MKYKIMYQPSSSLLELQLAPSESVLAESDAMVSMTPNVTMDTGAKGGLLGALKRSIGGESMFQNTFKAQNGQGMVAFDATMGYHVRTILRRRSGRRPHGPWYDLYADAQLRRLRELPGPQAAFQTRLIVATR